MGNFLETPNTNKKSIKFNNAGINIGATGMQGWRLEMEDAEIVESMPSKPDHTLLSVFDGHGGSGAAEYASKNMVRIIEETEEWKEYIAGGVECTDLVGRAFIKAYLDTDILLRKHQKSISGDSSGCTAVSVMITPRYIICANAGDSRSVMGTGGTTKPLSEDHKPDGEIERKRIESAGGTVHCKRVDGDLAVSRALGDFQYKVTFLSQTPTQHYFKVIPNLFFPP